MPKKFHGENSKSAAAKERKDAVRKAEQEKKQKELEDAYWAEDDKLVNRKLQRKEEKEKKHEEKVQLKQERQKMLDEEVSTLKSAKPIKEEKITRYEIELHKQKQAEAEALEKAKLEQQKIATDFKLEENINRLTLEHESARNVDEALALLTDKDDVDLHPEKRMRTAYMEYEEENLPRLKIENPNMRLSQLKQLLKKEWMKSPKNPLVQSLMKQQK